MPTSVRERLRNRAAGARMIEDAAIHNYRCLKKADLKSCRGINVLVGKNASGKTALLEALFLASAASPEVALRLKSWRGYDNPIAAGTFNQIDEAIWGDLFFAYDRSNKIEVRLRGGDNHNRSLEITYGESEESFPVQPNTPTIHRSAIEFLWTRHDDRQFSVRPEFTGGGYIFRGAETETLPAIFFASSHPFANQDNVNRFSDLSKRRAERQVVEAIHKEFEFIESVDIQSYAGVPLLHADVPYLPEKVPLVSVSSGVNKVSSILLALSASNKNILFVDEIENGIHYTRLESIWRGVSDIINNSNAQIFASTHSSECLIALANALEDAPENLTLIRSEMEDGKSVVEQFTGETAIKSIRSGEVR